MDSYQFFLVGDDYLAMRISRTHQPGAKRLTLIGPYAPEIPVVEPLTGCEFAALMEKLEAKGFEVIVTSEEKSLEQPANTVRTHFPRSTREIRQAR